MNKRVVSILLAIVILLSFGGSATALEGDSAGGVQTANKTSLLNKINEALAVNQSEYTSKSVEELQIAILSAQAVYAKADATQEETDAQIAALDVAIGSLVKPEQGPGLQTEAGNTLPKETPAREGLQNAIDAALKIDGGLYTKDSFAPLQAALFVAQGVYENPDAADGDFSAQLAALQNAVNALKEEKAAKTGTANVTAWDTEKDEPSALAVLLKPETVLEEINGYVYATLTFISADIQLDGSQEARPVKGTDLNGIYTYTEPEEGNNAQAEKVYASHAGKDETAGMYTVKARIIKDNVKADFFIGTDEAAKTVRLHLENVAWVEEENNGPENPPQGSDGAEAPPQGSAGADSPAQDSTKAGAPMLAQANLLADGFYGIPTYNIYTTLTGTSKHASTGGIKALDLKVNNGQMTVTMYMQGYGTGSSTWITNIVNIRGNTGTAASVLERDGNGNVTIFQFAVPYTEERITMGIPTNGNPSTAVKYLKMEFTTAVAKADKYSLYIALKEANAVKELGKGSFTDTSWNAFLDAIAAAEGVFDNASAPQGDVNAQVGLVHDAVDALVGENAPVDKAILNAKILQAERLGKNDHTDASWNALQAVLAEANATAEKSDATQFEVNQKARALQAALDALSYNSPVAPIPDINLKKALLNALNVTYGNDTEAAAAVVTENMMAALTALNAPNQGIKDMKGLEKAVNLESLNLSGNPLDDANRTSSSFGSFFQNFSAFSKLKQLNLSNCRLGDNSIGIYNNDPMIPGDILALRNCLSDLPNIESVDLSNNGLVGSFKFAYNGRFEHLKSFDLSGNRFNQIESFDGSKFPVLEKLDLSDNYLYWNEAAGSWIEPLMLAGDVVKHGSQKNLGDLFTVQQNNKAVAGDASNAFYYIKADNENHTLTLGDFAGNALVSFVSFGMELTTKVTIGETKVTTATMSDPRTVKNNGMLLTLSGYAPGPHEVPVTVMHLGGDTREYKLKFNVAPVPGGGADSAGIVDPYLQAVVCSKLGVDASHVITKTEMAGMTGSLNVYNVRDAQGIQYAAGLTSLILKGTYTGLPDLNGLTALTSLSLLSDDLEQAPDLSALTALKSLMVCAADNGFPVLTNQTALTTLILDNVGTKDYPAGLSGTIKSLDVCRANGKTYGVPEQLTGLATFRFLPNTDGEGHATTQAYSAAVDLTNIKNVTAPGSLSAVIGKGATAITGLSAQSAALASIQFDAAGGTVFPQGLGDVPNLTGTLSIQNNASGGLPDEYARLTKVTRIILMGSYADMPPEIASMTALTYLDTQSCGLTHFTADLSRTKLTTLNLWGNRLGGIPSADLLPVTLVELNLAGGNLITKVDDAAAAGFAKMTALKTLNFEGDPLVAFPSSLIKKLPALTSLNVRYGKYADIPADSFDNSTVLGTVRLGHALLANKNAGVISFMEGTGGAAAVTKLKTYQPSAVVALEAGTDKNFAYANLVGLSSSVGTIPEDPYAARALSLSVPGTTSSVTLTPDALLPDTVITAGGREYAEGQEIRIDNLVKGSNVVTLSCQNSFRNFLLTDSTAVYTLNIFVGDYVDDDFPAEGHTYNVKYQLYKSGRGDAVSMADSYFTKTATVRYKNGQFAIVLTTNKSSWIPDMHYYIDDELRAAELLEKNNTTDHATYRIYAHNLEDVVVINPYVTPMGYAPICDLRFNAQEAIDITDTLPGADKTDLVAAINRAEAELKKSIYTNASYNALKTKADEAKAVNAAAAATEEEVAAAASALSSAIEGLQVDPSKLANKASLKSTLDEAKAVKKGNHTDTAWNALQDAIADAQAVYDTLEAAQKDVDAAAKALRTAITLFNSSGEASHLDKDNLQDGSYSLNADMIKINRRDTSMSNDAVGHSVSLTVRNGVYYITAEFKGLNVDGSFGYLSRLKYYGAGFSYDSYGNPQGGVIPATVLSYQKDSGGKIIVDQYNDASNPYPRQLQFPLVNKANYEGNFVPLQVFVPIMESISAGSGTQDVLMRLDWTTLKTGTNPDVPADPDNPDTPAVNKSTLSSKITEAKSIAKGDYTDVSYQILQNAIAVAQGVLDSKYATQTEVNEQVTALANAINGLTRRPSGVLDKNNLQDGKYEARADLWHATQDKASMGNGSLNHTALIQASGGKLYMSVSVHPMQVGTITASLMSLQIKQANGSYAYANVIANNIAGGKPSAFQFALPSTDTFIPVKVDPQVSVMGDEPVDARLRISWDTLVSVSADTGLSTNTALEVGSVTAGTTTVVSEAASLSDKATGVKLEAEANVLPKGTTMKVAGISSGADYEKANLALEGIGSNFVLYDITLFGPDDSVVQPNGKVKVTIPVPEGMNEQLIAIYRINADGTKTLIESAVEDGYVVFYTNHFSLYAVVEKEEAAALAGMAANGNIAGNTGGKSADIAGAGVANTVKTGSGGASFLWWLIPIAAAAAGVTILIVRRKLRARGITA